jgi:hypothetical protein
MAARKLGTRARPADTQFSEAARSRPRRCLQIVYRPPHDNTTKTRDQCRPTSTRGGPNGRSDVRWIAGSPLAHRLQSAHSMAKRVHGSTCKRRAHLSREVELVIGDVRDPEAVSKALAGATPPSTSTGSPSSPSGSLGRSPSTASRSWPSHPTGGRARSDRVGQDAGRWPALRPGRRRARPGRRDSR